MLTLNKKFKNRLKKSWPRLLLNKYVLSTLAFVIWISLIDGHNLISQKALKQTIQSLKGQKLKYKELIAEAKIERKDIEDKKEKYAREKYFMHKENENVFIILNDKKEK